MKKVISLVLMVALLVCLMPTMAFATGEEAAIPPMPDDAKVRMTLQSGETTATVIVDNQYVVTATIEGTNVNSEEVRASIEMRNVTGLEVEGYRKAGLTLKTDAGLNLDLPWESFMQDEVLKFGGTTVKGKVNDKEFTYSVSELTKDEKTNVYTLTAEPTDVGAVRAAWQELARKIETDTQGPDDSKIELLAGAYLQAVTEKVTVNNTCIINPSIQGGFSNTIKEIKRVVSLDPKVAPGEDKLVMYAPAESLLQVGESKATLKTGVKVVSNVFTHDEVLKGISGLNEPFELVMCMVGALHEIIGNLDPNGLTVSILTDTCTITWVDGNPSGPVEKKYGDPIGELSAAPTPPANQKFDGWYNGDTKVTADTVVNGDMTLTARYSDIITYYPPAPSKPDPLPPAKTEATAEVNKYVEPTAYDEAEAAEVKAIMDKAAKDIAAAKTVEEIKAIEEAAKAEIDQILTKEEKAIIVAVEDTELKAKSKLTTLNDKKAVKVTWSVPKNMKFDGFDIFRSTRRYSGFGKKPFFTTTKTSYTNNKDLEKGKTYYYKVRGYKYVNGEKVYTDWSTKAWRTI